jgi:hypothetical protein
VLSELSSSVNKGLMQYLTLASVHRSAKLTLVERGILQSSCRVTRFPSESSVPSVFHSYRVELPRHADARPHPNNADLLPDRITCQHFLRAYPDHLHRNAECEVAGQMFQFFNEIDLMSNIQTRIYLAWTD